MKIEKAGFEGHITYQDEEAEYRAVLRYRRPNGNIFTKDLPVRGEPSESAFESAIEETINYLKESVENQPRKDFEEYEVVSAEIRKTETVFDGDFQSAEE